MWTNNNAQNSPKPNSAPALVDCTKCDTPIAAPANSNPGPKDCKHPLFIKICLLFRQEVFLLLKV